MTAAESSTTNQILRWQMMQQTAEQLAAGNMCVMNAAVVYRDPSTAPMRRLSVNLIHTYKHINEVPILSLLLRYYSIVING